MRLPWTIWRYLAKSFATWFAMTSAVLTGIIGVVEIVELFRRTSGKAHIGFILILKLTLLKLPVIIEQMLPLIVFFSCFLCIRSLNQKLELIAIRSSGVSMIQIVVPFIGVMAIFSVLYLLVMNPLSSTMFARFESLETKLFRPRQDTLSIVNSGLWLKKMTPKGRVIIHSKKTSKENNMFTGITLYFFDENDGFTKRLDAEKAYLTGETLTLVKPWLLEGKNWAEKKDNDKKLTLRLSLTSLEENFASPKTIPFASLPSFINRMEEMGFSATLHRSHWFTLLSMPFMYFSMILWAAFFSLRWQRHQKMVNVIGLACVSVFSLYIINEITRALGLSGVLPPGIAVSLSVGLIFSSGCGLLVYLQEK